MSTINHVGYLCLVSIELRNCVKTGNAYFSNTVASSVFQVRCKINLQFLVHHVALIYQRLKVPSL